MATQSLIAAWVAAAAMSIAGATALGDAFTNVNLGQAGAGGLNLSVLVTGPTVFQASNSSTLFNGNVGLANGSSTNVSGGGTISKNLYLDPGATLQSNFNSQFNVSGSKIVTPSSGVGSIFQAVTDVQAAANAAALLTANQTLGALGGSPTTLNPIGAVNAAGGRNTVINIASINITNPANNLVITGGANDYYIINITGAAGITVSNGGILTSGLIPTSHILFNLEGTADVTLTNGSSVLDGTYLAPFAGQTISLSPGTVNGAVIGYEVKTSSGPTVNGSPYVTPPVPLPASGIAGLVLIGGLAIGRKVWGR